MNTERMYEMLKDYESPTLSIKTGTVMNISDLMKVFPGMSPNDISKSSMWFRRKVYSNVEEEAVDNFVRPEPPLGIVPKYIWLERRQRELFMAMNRYFESRIDIPHEWISEFVELCESKDLK